MTLRELIEIKDVAEASDVALKEAMQSLPYEQCKLFNEARLLLAEVRGMLKGNINIHSMGIEVMEEST